MSDKILTYGDAPLVHEGDMISIETDTYTGTFLQNWGSISKGFYYPVSGYAVLVDKTDNDNVYFGGTSGGVYDGSLCGALIKFDKNGVRNMAFSRILGGTEYVYKMCIDYSTNSIVCASNIRYAVVYKVNKTTGENIPGFSQGAARSTLIQDVVMDSSGYIYACGGSDEHWILTTTGSSLPPWGSNIFSGGDQRTYTAIQDSSPNTFLIGGGWTTFRGEAWPYFLKATYDASIVKTYAAQSLVNGAVYHMIYDGSHNLLLSGGFTIVGGKTNNRIVKLLDNSTGIDTSFDTSNGFNGIVRRMTIDTSLNRLYCVGDFTTYRNKTANKIVAINVNTGEYDTTFDVSNGFSNSLYDIAIDSVGKVYVVGIQSSNSYMKYNDIYCGPLVRLNTDGSYDNYSTIK